MIGKKKQNFNSNLLYFLFLFSVISSLGKEVRFPFLDEQLVNYLHSIPIWYKADLRLPRGVGEKYLLRYIACHYLSLEQVSKYPKRAIQFGSRIAKLESKKEKASDQCSRLTTDNNNIDDEE
jgi:asparagine synthetase B (glutamine-hydrolysing)